MSKYDQVRYDMHVKENYGYKPSGYQYSSRREEGRMLTPEEQVQRQREANEFFASPAGDICKTIFYPFSLLCCFICVPVIFVARGCDSEATSEASRDWIRETTPCYDRCSKLCEDDESKSENTGKENKSNAYIPPQHNVFAQQPNYQPIINSPKAKITEIKIGSIVYGSIREVGIERSYNCTINGSPFVVTKYRAITLPDNVKSGEGINLDFALSKFNGTKIGEKDPAYLHIEYDTNGKLMKLSLPHKPVVHPTDNGGPALIPYKGHAYTLPVDSGHYLHLTDLVRANGGVVEASAVDQGSFIVEFTDVHLTGALHY